MDFIARSKEFSMSLNDLTPENESRGSIIMMNKRLWALPALTALAVLSIAIPALAQPEKASPPVMSNSDFHHLCAEGSLQRIINAIKKGANVNAQGRHGETPLMWAARANPHPEVATALIKAGADVNAKNKKGTTPLIMAAEKNSNPEVIIALPKRARRSMQEIKKAGRRLWWRRRKIPIQT